MNWQPDHTIERRLQPGITATREECREVKEYLTASFAAYLDQTIETVWEPLYEDISSTWGFAFGLRSRDSMGGPLQLQWYGVISHNRHGHTCAFVLLFAQDERAIHHQNREYLYFEFMADAVTGHRVWQSRGWASSEMHEWDGYRKLSKICEQKTQEEEMRRGNDA